MQKKRALLSYMVTATLAVLSWASLSHAGFHACELAFKYKETGPDVTCTGCGLTCCTGLLVTTRWDFICSVGDCTWENCGTCMVLHNRAQWSTRVEEPADPGGVDCPVEGCAVEITYDDYIWMNCLCEWYDPD